MSSDFEQLVIGAVLSKPELLPDIDLAPAMFTSASHEEAFSVLQSMQAHNEAIDLFTVGKALEQSTGRTGWTEILSAAMKACYAPGNARVYAEKVRGQHQVRQAREIAQRLSQSVDSAGPEAIDAAIQGLMELNVEQRCYSMSIKQACAQAIDLIDRTYQLDGAMPGITTGLTELDTILGGFHDADLTILAARPSMGKTAMLLNFALAADLPLGIVSSEQPGIQVGTRMIAMQGRMNAARLRNADLEDEDWHTITRATSQLVGRPIFINEKSGISILELMRQAREWKHRHGMRILYVDYVQRIKATDTRVARHEQVGEVVTALKDLARDLDIPVVALAQVNRSVEQRANKRPGMGDIKDSGTIEQEADTIISLYRDEVYDKDSPDTGTAELDVLKNRHGPTGFTRAVWLSKCMRFENFSGDRDKWAGPDVA